MIIAKNMESIFIQLVKLLIEETGGDTIDFWGYIEAKFPLPIGN